MLVARAFSNRCFRIPKLLSNKNAYPRTVVNFTSYLKERAKTS